MLKKTTSLVIMFGILSSDLFAAHSEEIANTSAATNLSKFEADIIESQGADRSLFMAQNSGNRSKSKKRRKKQSGNESRKNSQFSGGDFKELRLFLGPAIGVDGDPFVFGSDFAMSMGSLVMLGGLDYFSIEDSVEFANITATFLTINVGAAYLYSIAPNVGLEFGGKFGFINATVKFEPSEEMVELARTFGEELESRTESDSYLALAPYIRADYRISKAFSMGGEVRKPILFDSDAEIDGYYLLGHFAYRF